MRKTICIGIVLLLVWACRHETNEQTLNRAEIIMEISPDSAFSILTTIERPEGLDEALYMKYIVLHTLAKYKTYKEIKQDTVIFKSVKFYNKSTDKKHNALAEYMAGAVMQERSEIKEAIYYYNPALNTMRIYKS